jgi:hypothetical protein
MKEDKETSLIKLAMNRYDDSSSYWSDNFDEGKEDIDFTYGEQWPDDVKKSRKGRPCLTENRLLAFVHQISNQIRQSSPSIIPKPVDSKADIDTAEVLGGLIRNIQNISDADTIYDTASKNAIISGFGWVRIVTDYAGYDTFDQEIRLERVINPFSVLIDPNTTRLDGSDMQYAFVHDEMNKEDFGETYPDADITPLDGTDHWSTDKTVKVTEYFYKDYETKTLVRTSDGVFYKGEVDDDFVIEERDVDICTIKYAKMTKDTILEEGKFPGEYIPIVPVYGEEVFKDGKRQFHSMVRQAKDPQRMFNYWISASTEIIALQPKAPWIAAKGTFKSKAKQWAGANVENPAFLEYDLVHDKNGMPTQPPQRQMPPQGSQAMMQEQMRAADGIKATLGIYDASLGNQSPDISGKAIIARQVQGDNSNFHFIDNLSTAMKQVGRILVGLIPLIYTGERIIRILGEDDIEKMIPVNQGVVKTDDGYAPAKGQPVEKMFDLQAGKYDVIVEVGASYATKRQESANAILEIARVNPQILEVAGDLLMKSLDVPNAQEIAKRIRSIMDPALLGDDLEAQRMQKMTEALQQLQQKISETELALQAKQDDTKFKNNIELGKLENDRKKIEIEALKTMAEIQKMESETKENNADAMSSIIDTLSNLQADMEDVSGAVDVFLTREEQVSGEPQSPVIEKEENVQ